jgi:NADPH:quinone reductase-like Zn-dependent oxidoreductase
MMMRKGNPFIWRLFLGLFKPKTKISWTWFSGKIEEIWKNVDNFKINDEVFWESIFWSGTNAEYLCLAQDKILFSKPKYFSYFESAPICDGALTSMNFLKNLGNIKKWDKVLIIWASWWLGTSAVQIAKYYWAEVTWVCSTKNIWLVKSLGADKVLDYTKEDFIDNDENYDIIYDTIWKSSFWFSKTALTKNGLFISPVLWLWLLFQMIWTWIFGYKKAKFSATGTLSIIELKKLIEELLMIIEEWKLITVIDKKYKLKDVSEAHRYVEKWHKKWNVVIVN